jgi:hypothetical protein
MSRSVNLALACAAMLAAAVLAYVLTPHRLMARAHDVFDIDAHVPRAFGEWAELAGIQAIKPPPDGLEAAIYNQEVSRAYVDPEGRTGLPGDQAGHEQFRVVACEQTDPLDAHDRHPRGANRADRLLDADRL